MHTNTHAWFAKTRKSPGSQKKKCDFEARHVQQQRAQEQHRHGARHKGKGKGTVKHVTVEELIASRIGSPLPPAATPRREIRRTQTPSHRDTLTPSHSHYGLDFDVEPDISPIAGHAIAQLTAVVAATTLEDKDKDSADCSLSREDTPVTTPKIEGQDGFQTPKKAFNLIQRESSGKSIRSPKRAFLTPGLMPKPEIEVITSVGPDAIAFLVPPVSPLSAAIACGTLMGDPDADFISEPVTPECEEDMDDASVISRSASEDYSSDPDDDGPQAPVYLLTKLSNLLKEAHPGSMLVFDIDETLIVTRHAPSYLLTTDGVQTFQKFVHQKIQNWNQKNQLCRKLQLALKDKIGVEEDTAEVIRKLQDMGCAVLALTARYRELSVATENSLEAVGIDLKRNSPFPPYPIRDPHTDAVALNGVVYCNNQDKGLIFSRFIESMIFKDPLAHVRAVASGEAEPGSAKFQLPKEIFFVDDLYENAKSVCLGLTPLVTEELGVTVSCYHYVPSNLAEMQAELDEGGDRMAGILTMQMEVFIEEQRVLTNQEARRRIQGYVG